MAQYFFPCHIVTEKSNPKYFEQVRWIGDSGDIVKTIDKSEWLPLFPTISPNGGKCFTTKVSADASESNLSQYMYLSHPELQNFTDGEILVKGVYTGAGIDGTLSYYNGGIGVLFRKGPSDLGYLISRGIHLNGELPTESVTAVARYLRAYLGENQSSNVGTTAGTYLPIYTHHSIKKIPTFVRVRVDGTRIRAKAWNANETEPSAWGLDLTLSNYSTGKIGVPIRRYLETFAIEFIAVGTGGDAAPSSRLEPLRSIQGTLLKPDNTVASGCTVRIYDKETGCFLDEQTVGNDGTFSFEVELYANDLVSIVGVDQNNNSWRPPIHEAYPVL